MSRLLHGIINYHSVTPGCSCPSNPMLTVLERHAPAHAGGCFEAAIDRFTPDPSTTAARWRLGPVRNRRRSASLAPRWHRPMSIVLLAREGPCGRVLGSSNADRLRCRGGFRGKSVGRSSCRGIGPSKRSSSVDNHRDNGSHISGTRTKVGGQVLGKKLFGQHSSLIVEDRCAKPPTKVSARIGQKRFKSGNPRRRPNFLVMRGLARIRNSSPGQ